MAAAPAVVALSNSSTESSCLRMSSLPKPAPICGHRRSSAVINSTGSLALLGSGVDRRSAVSVAADSIFLVALCTGALHGSRNQYCCTAIQQHLRRRTIARRDAYDPHGKESHTRGLG